MSIRPPKHREANPVPQRERRHAPGAKGLGAALRRVKGVLARPLRLQVRGGQIHTVWIDRRHAALAQVPQAVAPCRTEPDATLLAPPPAGAGAALEVSEVSHDEFEALERAWSGTVPAALAAPADEP